MYNHKSSRPSRESSLKHSDINETIVGLDKLVFKFELVDSNENDSRYICSHRRWSTRSQVMGSDH